MILSTGAPTPHTSVRPPRSPRASIDVCLSAKALLAAAVGHTPSTPTPRREAEWRSSAYSFLPLLSLTNLGLPSFPHAGGSPWLVSKGLAVFQKARGARRLANALPPPPGDRAPLGGPPPAPPPAVQQPPPPELARGAVSARAGGKPAPAHLPLAAPARQQQRRFLPTGGLGGRRSPQRPRPLAFSFFLGFGILLPEPGKVLRREEQSEGPECRLPLQRANGAGVLHPPAFPPGPRRPGCDVTKGILSACLQPPKKPPGSALGRGGGAGVLGRSPFARSAAGQERQGAPGAGSQHPLFRKRAVGVSAFPALGTTARPAACSWTESRFPPIHPELGTAPSRPPALLVALAPWHLCGYPTPSAEPRDSQPLQRPQTLWRACWQRLPECGSCSHPNCALGSPGWPLLGASEKPAKSAS